MTNLYSMLDDVPVEVTEENTLDASAQAVSQMVEIMSADMDNSITLTDVAMEHVQVAETIDRSIRSLTLGSKEYFACLENGKSVIDILGKRMGVSKMPALEDFKNEYAAKSSHEIALESISDFLRKTWEAIKAFFKEFFKKIGIFMKRIVHANLDLVSYEKYNEELIAKLKAKNAQIKDNSPISTKLAALLADRGQETVDSDFVIRNGTQKITGMVILLEKIAKNDPSFLNVKLLQSLHQGLESLVRVYNQRLDGEMSDNLNNNIRQIKEAATMLISGPFNVPVTEPRSLPDSVYEKLFDDFSSANIKSSDLTILSLSNQDRPSSYLPKSTNLYLAHQNGERFFVSGYKDENSYASPNIVPISNLNNLIKLQDFYKREVKTLDLNACMKAVDKYEDEIIKVLDLLSSKYVRLVEGANASTNLDDTFFRNFFAAIRESGMDTVTYSNDHYLADQHLHQCVHTMIGLAQSFPTTEADINGLSYYMNHKPAMLKDAVAYVAKISKIDMKSVISAKYDPTVLDNFKKLQDLNTYLTHVFSKLQIILRTIVGDLFGLYTEIRYELVRYIYESSRRYSY